MNPLMPLTTLCCVSILVNLFFRHYISKEDRKQIQKNRIIAYLYFIIWSSVKLIFTPKFSMWDLISIAVVVLLFQSESGFINILIAIILCSITSQNLKQSLPHLKATWILIRGKTPHEHNTNA